MKLETTLDERPGFLHALPVFDLFMLVTMLLLLGPAFVNQSGVSVDLPTSQFQMQRYEQSIVVTLHTGGKEPQIYLGREAVSMETLATRLQAYKADKVMSRAMVLLKTDVGIPAGKQSEILNLILQMGFKVAIVGKTDSETPQTKSSDD